ncbi:MAG: prolyl oligopeptidase family serine peptidase [Sulfuricaulis sp.]|uniref:alpha/beta hydrolase family protein n=1 Tax=Sulfuricaulis sp. TaxID=2003553 RepID=UPI0034A35B7A
MRVAATALLGMATASVAAAPTKIDAVVVPVPAFEGDGRIVEKRPCNFFFNNYDSWLSFVRDRHARRGDPFDEWAFRAAFPPSAFRALVGGREVECLQITYLSDSLKVGGYVVRPRGHAAAMKPLVIFNRGGNRSFGQLVFANLVNFARWSQEGFVVLASQYRGGTGSEGNDEFGGADVDDVMNLFGVARELGGIDMRNVFMQGESRGGLMTYLALLRGAPVNAAVIVGGPTDLSPEADPRPEMQALYRELMPNFDADPGTALRARCVLDFADRLNVPLLILHGGADWRVDPQHALALAQRLQALQRPYELLVYAGDDHGLSRNAEDGWRRTVKWFWQHMK